MAYPPKRTNNFSRPGGRGFTPRPNNGPRPYAGARPAAGANPGGATNGTNTNPGVNPGANPGGHPGGGAPRSFTPRPRPGGGGRPFSPRPFTPRPPRPFNAGGFRGRNQDKNRINNYINAREIMLIDENGKNVGVVTKEVGLERARAAELDLVEITASATPPVCKILDYGKYKYQEEKRKKEAKKKQKIVHVKEIQIRPGIDQHDLQVKMKKMQNFLEDGDKVRVAIRLFGRASNQRELAMGIFQKVLDFLGDLAKVEKPAEMDVEKRRLMMMINRNPLKKVVDKNGDAHDEKNHEHQAEKNTAVEGDAPPHKDSEISS